MRRSYAGYVILNLPFTLFVMPDRLSLFPSFDFYG